MSTNDMHNKFLTASEVAEILNVSRRTVLRWLADGRIPAAIKLDRITRFNIDVVVDALASWTDETNNQKNNK